MLVHQFLERAARVSPEKIAVIHDDQRVSYRRIDAQARRLGACLMSSGIEKGDRVALLLENSVAYIVSYYAVLKVGAIASPLNPGLKPDGLQYLLDNLEPAAIIASARTERLLKAVSLPESTLKRVVITQPKHSWQGRPFKVGAYEEAVSQPIAEHPQVDLADTDLASIVYTSGSTGQPKGVMLSHGNIAANTISICQALAITPNDIQMVVLPFFYVMGKSLLNTHIAAGGTVVLNNRFLYPAEVVHQMIAEQVTSFSGVPSTYAYLLNRSPLANSRDKLMHLRYCSQAGGHMAKSLKLDLRKALPERTRIIIMYGATEAAARLSWLDPDHFDSKIDSIGKPIPGVNIRLLDDHGNEVAEGQEGELVASGPNIMRGYWRDSKDSARVLTDQGYHTGDIGRRDSDGFLYILRRKDGLLKVGGHRINPAEIEEYLMATDALVEIAAVGIPDKLLGTRLLALVVPKAETIEAKRLLDACAEGLPRYKHPAEFIVVRALPKKANGKIDREKCAAIASIAFCRPLK